MKNRVRWLSGLFMVALCCVVYASFMSLRTMPISDGWYAEYAWQVNHGSLPYRDFQYLFFPLYIHFIALFTKVFGYSMFALRVLGVFVFAGIGIAAYCIFAKLFDNLSAVIAAIVTALFLQSEVAQVFYDYIRFHDLFALITAYLLVNVTIECMQSEQSSGNLGVVVFERICVPILMIATGLVGIANYSFAKSHKILLTCIVVIVIFASKMVYDLISIRNPRRHVNFKKTGSVSSVLCGICVSAECMIKQSNGFIMIAFLLVYCICCGICLKKRKFFVSLRSILNGMMFAFGLMCCYLLATNSLKEFVQCCFGSAIAAKGGIFAALFNWIPSSLSSFYPQLFVTVFIVFALYFSISRYVASGVPMLKSVGILPTVVTGLVGTAICLLCIKSYTIATEGMIRFNFNLPVIAFFNCLAIFVLFVVYILWCYFSKKELTGFVLELLPCFPVLGVILAQGYGSGMSGGLAESQTAIGLGFLIAACIHTALRAEFKAVVAIVSIIAFCLTFTFAGRKANTSYYWWGLQQGPIVEHTETVDVPFLKGIYVRPFEKQLYETVYHDVISNTTEGDTIFTFPHCPVVYTMTDRHSDTFTKVQWFDVCSYDAILSDIEILRNNPPKMLVYITVPENAYSTHEALFSSYQTRSMRDFLLQELIPANHYELLHEFDLGNGFMLATYRR